MDEQHRSAGLALPHGSAIARRYGAVAIVLHWMTAFALFALIPMGWWMSRAAGEPGNAALVYQLFQLHKSVGLTVLALTVLRIGWRLTHTPPAAEATSRAWDVFAARTAHFVFYGLLLALPLSGWLYVSTGWSAGLDRALSIATSWFGLVPIPHIPGVQTLSEDARRALAFQTIGAHKAMAWGTVALVGLHVGAALKHHFADRDDVLSRMLPMLTARTAKGETASTLTDCDSDGTSS